MFWFVNEMGWRELALPSAPRPRVGGGDGSDGCPRIRRSVALAQRIQLQQALGLSVADEACQLAIGITGEFGDMAQAGRANHPKIALLRGPRHDRPIPLG